MTCPDCGNDTRARKTLPGRPMYLRTHFDPHGELCPPLRLGEARYVAPPPAGDQLTLPL